MHPLASHRTPESMHPLAGSPSDASTMPHPMFSLSRRHASTRRSDCGEAALPAATALQADLVRSPCLGCTSPPGGAATVRSARRGTQRSSPPSGARDSTVLPSLRRGSSPHGADPVVDRPELATGWPRLADRRRRSGFPPPSAVCSLSTFSSTTSMVDPFLNPPPLQILRRPSRRWTRPGGARPDGGRGPTQRPSRWRARPPAARDGHETTAPEARLRQRPSPGWAWRALDGLAEPVQGFFCF